MAWLVYRYLANCYNEHSPMALKCQSWFFIFNPLPRSSMLIGTCSYKYCYISSLDTNINQRSLEQQYLIKAKPTFCLSKTFQTKNILSRLILNKMFLVWNVFDNTYLMIFAVWKYKTAGFLFLNGPFPVSFYLFSYFQYS